MRWEYGILYQKQKMSFLPGCEMKKYIMYALLALLAPLAVLICDTHGVFRSLELKTFDALFYLKCKTSLEQDVAPITLVTLDDETYAKEEFKTPMALWRQQFSVVIRGLVDAGAAVVALDVLLPQTTFDELVDGYSKVWLKTLAYALVRGVPLVAGYVDVDGEQYLPHRKYRQILGAERLGLFNLTTDQDDFIRRHRLWFTAQEGDMRVETFPLKTAKAFRPTMGEFPEEVYIDFLSNPDALPKVSFAEVFEKSKAGDTEFLEQRFQGRIVFVGSDDTLSKDRHNTPLNYVREGEKKKLSGVELHAHVVNTLLAGRRYTVTPPQWRFALYLALAMLVTAINAATRARTSMAVFALMLPAMGLGGYLSFINYHLLPVFPGLVVIALTHILTMTYRHSVVDREKRKLAATFKKYLPPSVVERLVDTKDTDLFKGEHKRLCILISDIRGFTQYCEDTPPAQVVERLNMYFERMSAVVTEHGGIVDKFLGDGLLAFFGALEGETLASRAGVSAALKMMDELDELNARWTSAGQPPVHIGVGLHTGQAMVGNIGSQYKMEFTVIGDPVNLASRLQSKTKELNTPIVMSEATFQDTQDFVLVEEKGLVEIRGHAPVHVYALKGSK